MRKTSFILAAGLLLSLTGCQAINTDKNPSATELSPAQNTGLANPASLNCTDKGGKLDIRKSKAGEYGVCVFKDNRQCEEWTLMRGICPVGGVDVAGYENDAEIYCAITGGAVQGSGMKTPMCQRSDGTLCTVKANFDGECPNPANPEPNAGNVEAP